MNLESLRLDSRIPRGLRRLGAAIRRRLVLCGLSRVLLALVCAAAASLIVDYGLYYLTHQHMTLPQRLVVDGLCLACVVVVARRRLFGEIARRFKEDDLALVIEKANPALEERLISALQFVRPQARAGLEGVSQELVCKVVEQANELAGDVSFRSVLRNEPVRKAVTWAAVVVAAAGAFGMWRTDIARPWFHRNVLFQDLSYPKQTSLRVIGGNPLHMVRGGSLQVSVVADPARVVPSEVTFHMKFPSLGDLAESVKPQGKDSNVYIKNFPVVSEEFSFYVTGNDDRTAKIGVRLVEPPALEEVKLVIQPPAYTGQDPIEVRRNQGTLDIAEDSVLKIGGRASKDVAAVEILLDDRAAGTVTVASAASPPGTGAGRRRFEGELTMSAPKPFRPRLNLRIRLTDTDGFDNPKAGTYSINLIQDQAPTIQIEAVGMGGQISGKAAIPLIATAKDDYGVQEVYLEWAAQSSPQNVQRLPVKDYTPPSPDPAPVRSIFDLQQVAAESGSNTPSLQVGDTLRLQAFVVDSLPAPVGPHKAPSNLITLRIVTDDEVVDSVVDSQRAMREQLSQIRDMQMEVRDRCNAAVDQAGKETTLAVAFREVALASDSEQQIKDLLGALVGRLETLLDRIRNNRVSSKNDELRLQENIIRPLSKCRQDVVTPLIDALVAAKGLRDGQTLADNVQKLIPAQDSFIKLIETILAEMIKVENAQQVERGLRTIIRLSDKVRDTIRGGEKVKDAEPAQDKPKDPGGTEPK